MKFSLFYQPTYWPSLNGFVARLYEDILEEIEFADQNGLDAVWFAEHHFFGYGGVVPSVPVIAAAANAPRRRWFQRARAARRWRAIRPAPFRPRARGRCP